MNTSTGTGPSRIPRNKGKLTAQEPPLKLREIWAIRVRLQLSSNVRDLAMFNLAIDSKLRACDLMKLRVRDVCHGEHIASRATVLLQKTQRPVQFEITEQTRESVEAWMRQAGLHAADFLFPSRIHDSPHLSTRQYARLVHRWIASIGLDDTAYGTHTMRRTKVCDWNFEQLLRWRQQMIDIDCCSVVDRETALGRPDTQSSIQQSWFSVRINC